MDVANLAQESYDCRMIRAIQPVNVPFLPSLAALLAANLIPLAGVLFLGWSVFEIMMLFWLENVVIGLFNVLRMAFRLLRLGDWSALFTIPFFTIHYGAFCAGHGLFLLLLFRDGPMGSATTGTGGAFTPPEVDFSPLGALEILRRLTWEEPGFFWALLGLILSHGLSFLWNFVLRGEFRQSDAGTLMHAPYKRIVVLHIAIILGAFATIALGQSIYALVILILLKITFDIVAHWQERQRLGPGPSNAIAPGPELPDKPMP
jgi:hypothetical protein